MFRPGAQGQAAWGVSVGGTAQQRGTPRHAAAAGCRHKQAAVAYTSFPTTITTHTHTCVHARVHKHIHNPPLSTWMTPPVMALARGEQRKAAVEPTSSALSSFWMGAFSWE